MTDSVRYEGSPQAGITVVRTTDSETPAELAERLYSQEWLWASLTVGDTLVGEVGYVGPVVGHYATHGWWGLTVDGETRRGPS